MTENILFFRLTVLTTSITMAKFVQKVPLISYNSYFLKAHCTSIKSLADWLGCPA
ncbi:hypothetical protein FC82_GL000191 [Secundilactobacillus collinoides DSM 20515 = JCM 1123]|uniref:Uncharacterized protein n=1 Tax=Secundilactobacillus collinoides DSM 20515 = JCM 1123 TaxID=1423733 RepID=A0A0R2B538_SECCO|nr:hypothetical protein FC82_GL000191 [Secundilactobacillus collinoides DSM 20515 = JCM 1123]